MDYTIEDVKRDPAAFIEDLLADPDFRRELEEERLMEIYRRWCRGEKLERKNRGERELPRRSI